MKPAGHLCDKPLIVAWRRVQTLFWALLVCLTPAHAQEPAQSSNAALGSFRIALAHTGLSRSGPGVLLHDIQRGADDVDALIDTLSRIAPDLLVLLDFDHDLENRALGQFAETLGQRGLDLPFSFAPPGNSGLPSGQDLNGDGRFGTPDDMQGWAEFRGQGSMAVLSRYPLREDLATDHSPFLWRDLPNTLEGIDTSITGTPPRTEAALATQRLSRTSHWELPVSMPSGSQLTLLAWHATPSAFDGGSGLNTRRNAAETAFWIHRLNGSLGASPATPIILAGNANLDPDQGRGQRRAISTLLAHPLLQDPHPRASTDRPTQRDDVTAYWPDGPGTLRVDYLLPSADMSVLDHGLVWPSPTARHAVVWLELVMP